MHNLTDSCAEPLITSNGQAHRLERLTRRSRLFRGWLWQTGSHGIIRVVSAFLQRNWRELRGLLPVALAKHFIQAPLLSFGHPKSEVETFTVFPSVNKNQGSLSLDVPSAFLDRGIFNSHAVNCKPAEVTMGGCIRAPFD